MNKEVLIALIDKWTRDSEAPKELEGNPEAEISNAKNEGVRKGRCQCAQDLSQLISLLMDD